MLYYFIEELISQRGGRGIDNTVQILRSLGGDVLSLRFDYDVKPSFFNIIQKRLLYKAKHLTTQGLTASAVVGLRRCKAL